MSGYKRVNYYELCRLCATSQQKEKTHIFKEEGRKMQLLNKIQSCLSLTVHEHDYLPKVVCLKCLKNLESIYTFKQECVSSETMLSSYFKNFRYTEDFQKSGKVYIKDDSITQPQIQQPVNEENSMKTNIQQQQQTVVLPQTQNVNNVNGSVQNCVTLNEQQQQTIGKNIEQQHSQSFYTVQIPQNLGIDQQTQKIKQAVESKPIMQQQVFKTQQQTNNKQEQQQTINNVVVNANGEVINIGQIIDLESFMNSANVVQKQTRTTNSKNQVKQQQLQRCAKEKTITTAATIEENNIKIEVNENKLAPKKYQNYPKVEVAPPVDSKPQIISNPTVIFNATVQDYHQVNLTNFVPFQTQNSEPSTVNLNALNGDNNLSCATTNTVATYKKGKSQHENGGSGGGCAGLASNSKQSEKLHVCDVCHKSFKRREHLYQHIKLHTGFRPYTCENCNKSFMRKEHLLRHMTSHSGQKNYTCNICDKSFSRNDNLLKHKKTHDKQNSFTCEVCQKQFVMKHYYLAHKMTHEVVERCIGQTLGILKA